MTEPQTQEHGGRVGAPSGTVTFLFTDIEGSTKLLEHLRGQYATLLAEHCQVLRAAFARWNGHEIDTQGDAFFAAFPRAVDAVGCVMEAQRALSAHQWPEGVTVRVRMGLHTGEPISAGSHYVGMDVHLAARIGAVGHGGQVLLSQTTRDLIYQDLPIGASLHDLGPHKLKDIRYAQPLYQLNIQGLPSEFPPLRALSVAEEPPAPGQPPFKGLQYFDEADADLFFGREQLTAELVEYVRGHRFLTVIGASGSGKSSIVRAGLIPALRREHWHIHIITPTAHPLEALATTLMRGAESIAATAPLADDLARDPRNLRLFVRKERVEGRLGSYCVLLVVDQFEELFTLCREEAERRAFVDNLLFAVEAEDSGIKIVITLRADFYDHVAQYSALRELVSKHQEYIGPMNAEELRRAIEEPAKRGDWEFATGLVDLMLHDIGATGGDQPEPGALPLLSHALLETWKRRRGTVMTFRGYSEAGGVRGAIAKTAETVHSKFSEEQRAIARSIFLRLTELGEGTQDTRRRAVLGELIPPFADAHAAEVVIKSLADARLITTSEGYAEVAHEALIREWQTLREWLNQDREGLRLHRHLTEEAQAWLKLNREPGELYRGARLAQALEWARTNAGEMNPLEREFLEASRQLLEREEAEREAQRQRELAAAQKLAEAERRRATILRWAMAGSSILLVVMIGLAAFAFLQRDAAENERRIAFVRELSVNAVNNLNIDPERSILLALQAVSASTAGGTPVMEEAEEALHRAVQASRLQLTLRGHTAGLYDVAFSPDGTRLATTSTDKSIKVWDAATGQLVLTICCHADAAQRIAFSPDGKRLATSSFDKTAKIWDAATGQELLTLRGHTDILYGVAFSPDGTRVATGSLDKSAKVWDATTGKLLLTLSGHTGGVYWVTFSPDGTRIATGSWNNEVEHTVRVWDAVSGNALAILKGHGSGVWGVVFSPDGKRLATSSGDSTVKIWDTDSWQPLITMFPHTVPIALAYSPDGTRLALANNSGTAQVWNPATGELLLTLAGHKAQLWGVSFSPDGKRLATASNDGTARVWDITPEGSREWLTIQAHDVQTRYIAYSPDGTRVATSSLDKTAKVWDAVTGKLLVTLSGHTNAVNGIAYSADGDRLATLSLDQTIGVWDVTSGKRLLNVSTQLFTTPQGPRVAFSPDGKRIAGPGTNNTAKIWDSNTGQELLILSGHTGPVLASSFSPDGTRLATAGYDRVARVWDAATGKELLTLSGHSDMIMSVKFSSDGRRIATGSSDGTAKVWDAATGKLLLTLSGHQGIIFDVAFSPDGTRVATGSGDGTVKLWDIATTAKASGQPLTLYNPYGMMVSGVSFSPDGKRLAVSANDGTARIYALPLDDIISIAKTRVTRGLTTDECQKFLHVEKCP